MGESFVGEIETQQHAAARAPPDPRAAQAPARPSPYDLYIEFQEVAALWTCASDHPDELTYRCAFQSVEMGLALLADAAHDERPAARREARMAALAANVAAQVTLARRLVTGAPVPPSRMTPEAAISPGVRALRGLGPTHRSLLAHISDAILEAHFPIPLGIEPDLTRLRAEQGFAAPAAPSGPYLPYESWVQPERVASLVLRDPHSAEDRLFATVHQMTECWLRLVLDRFVRAEAPARQGAWDEAAAHLEQASMILAFLVEHIELLHLMVVADYHPLRVALRGASGAQSAAARVATVSARQFVAPVQQALEARGLTILDVDRFPHDHAGEHRYLEAVGTLERRLMAFYFQHFQLARKVLGTKSLGSLGFEVRALAERFTKPIFPEIDDARFDHVMLTNLAHGGDAGRLIA
ncbi:MAG TPA: hypothetical protein VGR28_08645, partial [Candidatus Thermoplasmatota archaeon]|nr:hypothetical protein [Candidatus Thermoplasmatota archaeon]